MALPTMTPEQRAAALEKAAEVRRARRDILDAVKTGRTSVADVVRQGQDEHDPAAKMRVLALVKAVQGVGPAKASHILAAADVAETKRVNGLGPRQQEALVAAVAAEVS